MPVYAFVQSPYNLAAIPQSGDPYSLILYLNFTDTRSLTGSHMHVLGEQDFRNISISSDISTSASSSVLQHDT